MADCCDVFKMVDEGDSFQSWNGLRGPYYIPHLSADGVLSWTNTGNLPNPAPVDISGPPGSSVELRGPVASVEDLPATASSSELWLVGTASPYDGYFYNGVQWENAGQIAVGPVGPTGATPDLQIGTVETGAPGSAAEASITGTPEEPLLNLKLPRGQQGPSGPGIPSGGETGDYLQKSSATDYDAEWTKPSDTAPLMDGTASPGTSLVLSRRDHRHPTDTSRASATALATYTRPNLLDNWYFVGGGSQLGYGVFPVNQRGQTVYQTSGAFTIDRWLLYSPSGRSAELTSNGLMLATENAQGDWCLVQELPVSPLLGKTVTASIKVESVNGRGYIHLYVNPTIPLGSVSIASAGVYSVTLTVPTDTTRIRFAIGAPTSMVVSACKVEIGDSQTLAHQENGTWVINEVPDYGEQLLRCQHYTVLLPGTSAYNGYANSETVVRIAVPCPAPFAGAPSLQYGGTGFSYLRLIGNGVALSPTSATASIAGNEIVLEFTVSGATQNMPYALKNNGVSILIYVN